MDDYYRSINGENLWKIMRLKSVFPWHEGTMVGGGESGYGRSSGYQGLMEYTQTKSVWIETAHNAATQFGYAIE